MRAVQIYFLYFPNMLTIPLSSCLTHLSSSVDLDQKIGQFCKLNYVLTNVHKHPGSKWLIQDHGCSCSPDLGYHFFQPAIGCFVKIIWGSSTALGMATPIPAATCGGSWALLIFLGAQDCCKQPGQNRKSVPSSPL